MEMITLTVLRSISGFFMLSAGLHQGVLWFRMFCISLLTKPTSPLLYSSPVILSDFVDLTDSTSTLSRWTLKKRDLKLRANLSYGSFEFNIVMVGLINVVHLPHSLCQLTFIEDNLQLAGCRGISGSVIPVWSLYYLHNM